MSAEIKEDSIVEDSGSELEPSERVGSQSGEDPEALRISEWKRPRRG